jgi:hypothetical protein
MPLDDPNLTDKLGNAFRAVCPLEHETNTMLGLDRPNDTPDPSACPAPGSAEDRLMQQENEGAWKYLQSRSISPVG